MIRSAFAMAGLAAAVTVVWAHPARACGGFFCNSQPISQSGEQIAFAVDGDAVDAHVQITYAGEAPKFAWVVPVQQKPTLSVGSAAFFTYLASLTQPTYQLEYTAGSQCQMYFAEDAAGGIPPSPSNGGGKGVEVVSQESVGPYEAATLKATDADALTQWLTDNGYNLTVQGAAALKPYVGPTYYFVALKLQSGKSTGDLRPIVLHMEGSKPCIPIRLTAIAADPNMPITAYFLSSGRAVPMNFEHVVLNEQRIDWLNYGSNYTSVAQAAVKEAGGHAFLTEFAGSTTSATKTTRLLSPTYDTAKLGAISDPVGFVQELINQNFPRNGLLSLLEKYVPEPASLKGQVPENQFYNQIQQYASDIANDPGRAPFDAHGFAAELQATIIDPLAKAQATIDGHPYLTRLFTAMSPELMTVDPDFDFNSGLGDASNVHVAKATCDGTNYDSPTTITLADGRVFQQTRTKGPDATQPAAQRIEQLGTQGPPIIIKDYAASRGSNGCNCDAIGATGSFVLFGLGALMRRSRSRRA